MPVNDFKAFAAAGKLSQYTNYAIVGTMWDGLSYEYASLIGQRWLAASKNDKFDVIVVMSTKEFRASSAYNLDEGTYYRVELPRLRELGVPERENTPGIRYVLFDWREREKKYYLVKGKEGQECTDPLDMSTHFVANSAAKGSYKLNFQGGGLLADYTIAGYDVLKATARKCLEAAFTCRSATVDNR